MNKPHVKNQVEISESVTQDRILDGMMRKRVTIGRGKRASKEVNGGMEMYLRQGGREMVLFRAISR
jgi:hypothetical protein